MTVEKPGRIINVTHQIPYELTLDNDAQWQFTSRQNHHAMYGGIRSLELQWQLLYIGWTGQPDQDITETNKKMLTETLRPLGCLPLFVDTENVEGHYDGYCKSVLWPLFHYMIWNDATDGRLESQQWEAYVQVNQQYTDFVCDIYQQQEDNIIWVHDYHLLLVPAMIRAKYPKARIGLFIHSPFPTSEIFRCLPKRQEILKGMIGANLVGFQTYAYARHFISTCTRVLGYESTFNGVHCHDDGHFCHVGTFPIGIDPIDIGQRCQHPDVQSKRQAIVDMYTGTKLLVGRDKIDLSKGVLQKLAAFESLLQTYPQWRNKAVLIQLTEGSHTASTPTQQITDLVAHINSTYGSLAYTPVLHFHQQVQPDEYYALLSTADAALITANRDGMNTTSLEYVVCQEEKLSPLILSELTGTAGSLSSALMVNPWDYKGVAKAIHEALIMSDEEKQSRHEQMLAHVKKHTASFWAQSFINVLLESIAASEQSSFTPILETEAMLKHYTQSKKRLLCFDYDGTLTDNVVVRKLPSRKNRAPTPAMIDALQNLCNDPHNQVWIISGRDEATLDNWLGTVQNLGLSAEHGSFIKNIGSQKWIHLLEHVDMSWKHDVVEIFTYYAERTQGSFIEHKRNSITWHYHLANADYGAFQSKECQNHLEISLSRMPVEVLVGKKYLEVRPTATNKGEIMKRLLSIHTDVDFVMCCGDDKTDEDMFKVLNKLSDEDLAAFSVVVGMEDTKKKTMASWRLPTVQDVLNTFTAMAASSSE